MTFHLGTYHSALNQCVHARDLSYAASMHNVSRWCRDGRVLCVEQALRSPAVGCLRNPAFYSRAEMLT